MIQVGTVVHVIDNSGAKKARCLKILSTKKTTGEIGDLILVSVQDTFSKQVKKVKKGEMHKALITESKKKLSRYDGSSIHFIRNSVILVSEKLLPLGTRVNGTVSYELRKKNFLKVLSLSPYVV